MKLVDSQGGRIRLADNPKSGGEGSVHGVIGSPNLVAKIYHSGSTAEPEKLRLLIAAKNDALLRIAAWPTGTLHEKKAPAAVVGFLMPKISGYEEIHRLYSPGDRLQIFPDADWRMLATAAMNLAAAFQAVHEHGFLVADVNEANTFVAADGSIRLIDCDSFQVRTADGRVFRCGVGRPEFTPPGSPGTGASLNIDRDENHDRFGLAVMIFLLLFMGRHPFPGGIQQNQFLYSRNGSTRGSSPPPGALTLDALPFSLAVLFERAFAPPGNGKRPSPAEWYSALAEFRDQLQQCPSVQTHYYHPVANRCPWCRLEAKYPVRLFRFPARSRLSLKDAACLVILLLALGAGLLAIGHRPSAVVPYRADGDSRRVPVVESQEEITNRTVLELVTTLDGDYADEVHRSLRTLKTMGPTAAPAVPRLTKVLLQNDPTYRADNMLEIQSRALEVLQGIDPNWLSSNQCEQLANELTEQLERSRAPSTARTPLPDRTL